MKTQKVTNLDQIAEQFIRRAAEQDHFASITKSAKRKLEYQSAAATWRGAAAFIYNTELVK